MSTLSLGRAIDLTGRRFGRWAVLSLAAVTKFHRRWHCRCDCGTERVVCGGELRRGNSISCGCFAREEHSRRNRKHGEFVGKTAAEASTEYQAWRSMIRRCYDPRLKRWKHYGGRGITVCEAWRGDFGAFIRDVGRKPAPKLSLDRINNDGNYEPGNVRWATYSQQNSNRRPMPRRAA